jgi:hypothetical protein
LDFLRVGRRPEHFQRVALQELDPHTDIRRVLCRDRGDAELVAQNHAGDFGTQLLLGVTLAPEGMQQITVEP